nr:MAG TPA: hypothetical protein [Caudoviricetes sp.]
MFCYDTRFYYFLFSHINSSFYQFQKVWLKLLNCQFQV